MKLQPFLPSSVSIKTPIDRLKRNPCEPDFVEIRLVVSFSLFFLPRYLMHHPYIRKAIGCALVTVFLVSIPGCGPNYGGRQEVKGTVKLKGQPLDQGVIDFTPLGAEPTK